jgi:succinate dehydrogenase assembly factor 1
MARAKPPAARPSFRLLARYTFRTNAHTVSPRDVNTIEHLMRRARRELEMYAAPSVRACHVSDAMRAWERDVYRERDR